MRSILALLCLLWTSTFCISQGRKHVEGEIRALGNSFGGRVGVAAKNLVTGESILVDADSLFPTASVIKLPILVELFQRFHDGMLSPLQQVVLDDDLKKPGNGVLQFLHGGQSIVLVDVGTLMIILSDNTATNHVIEMFGNEHDAKLEAVNRRMRSLGLRHTKLLNKLYSFATKKKTEEAVRFGIGVSSPADMALLLERIARGEAVSPSASDSMIAIMRNQTDKEMAARWLPTSDEDTTFWIANKTGSLDDRKIDVGIVSKGSTKYVYAIFCDGSTDLGEMPDNKAMLAIARISRILYEYYTAR